MGLLLFAEGVSVNEDFIPDTQTNEKTCQLNDDISESVKDSGKKRTLLSPNKINRVYMESLISISRFYYDNVNFIIPRKGSISFKTQDKIWVKTSGWGIKIMENNERGFDCFEREDIRMLLKKQNKVKASKGKEKFNSITSLLVDKRTVVEFFIHEVLPFDFVVHTQSSLSKLPFCTRDFCNSIHKQFKSNDLMYVDYIESELMRIIYNRVFNFKNQRQNFPHVLVVENYGVFFGENTIDKIGKTYRWLERIRRHIESQMVNSVAPVQSKRLSIERENFISFFDMSLPVIVYDSSPIVQFFTESRECFDMVLNSLTPWELDYDKFMFLFVKKEVNLLDEVITFRWENGVYPKIIGVEQEGVFALGQNNKIAHRVLAGFKNLLRFNILFLQ